MKKTGKKVLAIILSAATVLSGCGLNDLQEAYEQLQSACSQKCLHFSVAITGNGLKFIYGNKARFVSGIDVIENLV